MFVDKSTDREPQTGNFDKKKQPKKHPTQVTQEDALFVSISADSASSAGTAETYKNKKMAVEKKTSVDVKV